MTIQNKDYNKSIEYSNKSLLVFSPTSETWRQYLHQCLNDISLKKYDDNFNKRLIELGISEHYIESLKTCSIQWQYNESLDSTNWNLFLNKCKKKGCPCCSRTSLNALKLQYEGMFLNKPNLRRFTYTWKKKVLDKAEIKRRQLNLKALDKRLARAGLVTTSCIRSVEWTDKENGSPQDGIHYHVHELRSSYLDLDRMQQPVRDIVVRDKFGKVTYSGSCGLFEQIQAGKRVLQVDGFLNVWVLGILWKEITGDSYRVYTEKIYDYQDGMDYVLKYASKSPKFKFPETMYSYIKIFSNCKTVYKVTQHSDIHKVIECKIIDSDTKNKFPKTRYDFDIEKHQLRESRITLRYQEKISKKIIKEIEVIKFSFMREFQMFEPAKFNNNQSKQESGLYAKLKQYRYLFENLDNWNVVENIFDKDDIDKLLTCGDIFQTNRGYHLV